MDVPGNPLYSSGTQHMVLPVRVLLSIHHARLDPNVLPQSRVMPLFLFCLPAAPWICVVYEIGRPAVAHSEAESVSRST